MAKPTSNIPQYVISLAGNPNVGKSTIFNNLTGLRQHTGNWPGKTVSNAKGNYIYNRQGYTIVDLPGTYSLFAHSAEEEAARDFICFGAADATVIVCDATCLERNLNLILQTLEICPNSLLCINLIDEAAKKNIAIDSEKLSTLLHCRVVMCAARNNQGLDSLREAIAQTCKNHHNQPAYNVHYPEYIEKCISWLLPSLSDINLPIPHRWLALRLLESETSLLQFLAAHDKKTAQQIASSENIQHKMADCRTYLQKRNINNKQLCDDIVAAIIHNAEILAKETVTFKKQDYAKRDMRLDKIFCGKGTSTLIMILLLLGIFWLTIVGANYPSQILSQCFVKGQDVLTALFMHLKAPVWLYDLIVNGMYKTLSWVVAVMLPPMAIFFPLFTLLEDFGYLPRVAFNLDHYFKKACSCGKQALCMCMGFGCNAAGVTGCRIIDSPRERMIAILTNSFVPCNGRFPMLIAIITMFFIPAGSQFFTSFLSAVILTLFILFSIFITFAVSKLLSKTLLRGLSSSFTLELPPYRKPQISQVLIRSLLDRTLFVLGRAIIVAAPAGAIIWLFANIQVDGQTLLAISTEFFDPFARAIGLDGVILMAFILGFPANEIVVPLILMAYMATGTLTAHSDLYALREILSANGWTWLTALCTIIFSLMHWPCSTTCLTIKKESGSWKWTALAIILPFIIGSLLCSIINSAAKLSGLI